MGDREVLRQENGKFSFRAEGKCPLCQKEGGFAAVRDDFLAAEWHNSWFREHLKCVHCDSVPRERALFSVIEMLYPNWRELRIHEGSPLPQGVSLKMMQECPGYRASQYDPEMGFGKVHPLNWYQSEDLEQQTFADASFDIVVTQDVFEHLFAPDRAIREIARTLKPGGAHILTVPLVRGLEPSRRRASMEATGLRHLLEPQYHGNPMSSDGSLVTVDWGYDIMDYFAAHSGLAVSMYYFDDLSKGIRAVYNEVLVCRKMGPPPFL